MDSVATLKKRGPYKKRKKSVVVKEKRSAGRPLGSVSSKKATLYAAALEEGKSDQEAKRIAGYSEKSQSLNKLPAVRLAIENLEKEREKLQCTPGMTMRAVANRFRSRATDEKITPSVQTDNDKALVGMLNYTPEKKVTVNSIGMMMEFKDVSLGELLEFRKEMKGEGDFE